MAVIPSRNRTRMLRGRLRLGGGFLGRGISERVGEKAEGGVCYDIVWEEQQRRGYRLPMIDSRVCLKQEF
jgi:hypothetical protein